MYFEPKVTLGVTGRLTVVRIDTVDLDSTINVANVVERTWRVLRIWRRSSFIYASRRIRATPSRASRPALGFGAVYLCDLRDLSCHSRKNARDLVPRGTTPTFESAPFDSFIFGAGGRVIAHFSAFLMLYHDIPSDLSYLPPPLL